MNKDDASNLKTLEETPMADVRGYSDEGNEANQINDDEGSCITKNLSEARGGRKTIMRGETTSVNYVIRPTSPTLHCTRT